MVESIASSNDKRKETMDQRGERLRIGRKREGGRERKKKNVMELDPNISKYWLYTYFLEPRCCGLSKLI